jgi:hypothetical protein
MSLMQNDRSLLLLGKTAVWVLVCDRHTRYHILTVKQTYLGNNNSFLQSRHILPNAPLRSPHHEPIVPPSLKTLWSHIWKTIFHLARTPVPAGHDYLTTTLGSCLILRHWNQVLTTDNINVSHTSSFMTMIRQPLYNHDNWIPLSLHQC